MNTPFALGAEAAAAHVVAIGWPAAGAEMARLASVLGPGWLVIDIVDAPRDADVVLVHRCSPQAVQLVRREFPRARVVLVEPAEGAEGPDVCRCLSAGAAAHVLVRDALDVAAAVLGSREFASYPRAA